MSSSRGSSTQESREGTRASRRVEEGLSRSLSGGGGFGHLMPRVDSLEKTLMLGGIGGRKRRGRQKLRWLDGITDSMDVLSQNGRGGWTPLRPLRGFQETRVASREESGVLGFPSRRGLTPRGSLECNPEIPAFPGEEE